MSTTGTIARAYTATGTNRTDVQVSKDRWNATLVVSGGATGALLVRDSAKTDGWGLIDAVATGRVLISSGVGAEPAWSASPTLTTLTLGSLPASAGHIRLPTAASIRGRNATNLGDLSILATDASDRLIIGDDGTVGAANAALILRATNQFVALGGVTSSFPAFKRSSAALHFRLGDDSAFADISAAIVSAAAGTATPAGGSTAAKLLFGTTAGFGIYYGSGAPTVSAAQGSLYLRSDGSSGSTRLYVNTNGTTGWTNVTTAA